MMTLLVGTRPIFGDYRVTIQNVSFAEFLEFADEDIACELLDGVLVITSPAGYEHKAIFRFLLIFLDQVGVRANIGRALGSRFAVRLDPKWAPEPDVIFYGNQKRALVKEAFFDGAPDLVVEILSPSNRKDDIEIKLPKYTEAMIPEIWVVDPRDRNVSVHNPGFRVQIYDDGEDLVRSRIFPQIKLKLKWLWDDKIDPVACLDEIENL